MTLHFYMPRNTQFCWVHCVSLMFGVLECKWDDYYELETTFPMPFCLVLFSMACFQGYFGAVGCLLEFNSPGSWACCTSIPESSQHSNTVVLEHNTSVCMNCYYSRDIFRCVNTPLMQYSLTRLSSCSKFMWPTVLNRGSHTYTVSYFDAITF